MTKNDHRRRAWAEAWVATGRFGAPAPVTVAVKCGGESHAIRYTPGGPLAFVGHGDLTADRVLAEIGGHPCRCVEVLWAWRAGREADLPADLKPHVKLRNRLRTGLARFGAPPRPGQAGSRRPAHVDAHPTIRFDWKGTLAAVRAALHECRYPVGEHVVKTQVDVGRPRISSHKTIGPTGPGGPDEFWRWSFAVGLAWPRRVYRPGLAVTAAGYFVAAVLDPADVRHVLAYDPRTRTPPAWWWWPARDHLETAEREVVALVGLPEAAGPAVRGRVCRLHVPVAGRPRVSAVWNTEEESWNSYPS